MIRLLIVLLAFLSLPAHFFILFQGGPSQDDPRMLVAQIRMASITAHTTQLLGGKEFLSLQQPAPLT